MSGKRILVVDDDKSINAVSMRAPEYERGYFGRHWAHSHRGDY